MKNTKWDEKPTCGGVKSFASNIDSRATEREKISQAFDYGFRMGWQTHWYEVDKLVDESDNIEELI